MWISLQAAVHARLGFHAHFDLELKLEWNLMHAQSRQLKDVIPQSYLPWVFSSAALRTRVPKERHGRNDELWIMKEISLLLVIPYFIHVYESASYSFPVQLTMPHMSQTIENPEATFLEAKCTLYSMKVIHKCKISMSRQTTPTNSNIAFPHKTALSGIVIRVSHSREIVCASSPNLSHVTVKW